MLSGLIIFLIGKETIKITIIETNSSHVSTGKYYRWRSFFFRISKIKWFKVQFWCQLVCFGHFALYVFAAIQKISTIQGWDSIAKIAFPFVKLSNSLMVSFYIYLISFKVYDTYIWLENSELVTGENFYNLIFRKLDG